MLNTEIRSCSVDSPFAGIAIGAELNSLDSGKAAHGVASSSCCAQLRTRWQWVRSSTAAGMVGERHQPIKTRPH